MSDLFSRTIYVGNLPADIRQSEIEDLFYKFESSRDAEDAIRGRDGYSFDGCWLMVELAHGGRGPSSQLTAEAVMEVEEMAVAAIAMVFLAIQIIEDHMCKAGDGCLAQVSRDSEGTYGLVDYTNYEDMRYAVKKYKGSPSRSRSRSLSRSRSPRSRRKSQSRSASTSPVKTFDEGSRSKSRSRSVSHLLCLRRRRVDLAVHDRECD